MIANTQELTFAVRSLTIMEAALQALREQLRTQNPKLLEVTERPYEQRIASLQTEIGQYLGEHPSAVSLILTPQSRETAQESVVAGNS